MKIKFLKDYSIPGPRNGVQIPANATKCEKSGKWKLNGEIMQIQPDSENAMRYEKGQEVEVENASHFLRRGVAEEVKAKSAPKKADPASK